MNFSADVSVYSNMSDETVTSLFYNSTDHDIEPNGNFNVVALWLWKICPPIILLFGTFGNVMIIVIHSRQGAVMSALSVYFIALAVSDLTLLYATIFISWVYYFFRINLGILHGVVCKSYIWITYVAGILSAWILVAMTVQRAICVIWPHRANVLCSARKSKISVFGITLLTIILHAHLPYGFDIVDGGNTTATLCTISSSDYNTFFVMVWTWVDLFIFSLLPWFCLIISNSFFGMETENCYPRS